MSEHVCPWWIGYLLASPLRKLWQKPHEILAPHVSAGMTVVEPGPGMGFFTLELARLVGPHGHVIAIDVQQKMLDVLARRAKKANLSKRIMLRHPHGEGMGLEEFKGQADFALVMAVLHELPNAGLFFREAQEFLKPGGKILLCEPRGHVDAASWIKSLRLAEEAGLREERPLTISSSHATLLVKYAPVEAEH